MPKTFVDGREVKKWWVDGRQVKKAYLDGRLIYQLEYTLNITASNHNVGVDWASQVNRGSPVSMGLALPVKQQEVQSIGQSLGTLEAPAYD